MQLIYRTIAVSLLALPILLSCSSDDDKARSAVNLSPSAWPPGEYDKFMADQNKLRESSKLASGNNGAITVAYNPLAARAGMEALRQGGNAIDAAMTTAMAQNVLNAGSYTSFFGIMSLVYYDAKTDSVHTMNAEWNTLLEEDDPLTIPGGLPDFTLSGDGEPSGRTALVGGFLKGVESAHNRFGQLPFAQLFEPAIYMAEQGVIVNALLAQSIEFRAEDLMRLPASRELVTQSDGTLYQEGDLLKQEPLANTLRKVAQQGSDYIYKGAWAEKLIEAVNNDDGKMILKDLKNYEVIWDEPLTGSLGDYTLFTLPPPNGGGVAMIEAQKLAIVSGLNKEAHWSQSANSFTKAIDITQAWLLGAIPKSITALIYPDVDLSDQARITDQHAEILWPLIDSQHSPTLLKEMKLHHSDNVVVIDNEGNIAALIHTINSIMWGKTGIIVDGISIGDPASIQQTIIAEAGQGARLWSPLETGILFKENEPMLGFAAMGAGMHQKTFQCLMNVMYFDMDINEAINTPDFYYPNIEGQLTVRVPEGAFSLELLESLDYPFKILPISDKLTLNESNLGEGLWIAAGRDLNTGELKAASHNRNNSTALAY